MSTAGFVRRRRACGDEGAGARRGGGARGLSEGVCPKARGERVPRVGSECPAGPRGQESHRGERDALGSLSGECAGPSQGMRVTGCPWRGCPAAWLGCEQAPAVSVKGSACANARAATVGTPVGACARTSRGG